MARPWFIVVFVVAIIAVAGTAYAVGTGVATPESVAVGASDETIPVDVVVENRAVGEQKRLQGSVVAGATMAVDAVRQAGTARAVVMSTSVDVGAAVTSGTVLANVSGRPVIALTMPVPLYRNLALGDRGDDVSAFQTALADAGLDVEDTGVVDEQTQWGIRDLYETAESTAPGGDGVGTFVDLQELALLPVAAATVVEIAPTGTILGGTVAASTPGDATSTAAPAPTAAAEPDAAASPESGSSTGSSLATLRIGADSITAHVSVLDAAAFPVGQAVTLAGAAGATATSSVSAVGAFTSSGDDGAGYPLTVGLGDAPAGTFTVGQAVAVSVTSDAVEGPAVPLIAVRQRDGKTFVQPSPPDSDDAVPAVEIVVLRQADGWVAIQPVDALPVGTSIRVGP